MIVRDHRPNGVAPGGLMHSEQDTQSRLRRTAVLDDWDCRMEIDVLGGGEVDGRWRIAPLTGEIADRHHLCDRPGAAKEEPLSVTHT